MAQDDVIIRPASFRIGRRRCGAFTLIELLVVIAVDAEESEI